MLGWMILVKTEGTIDGEHKTIASWDCGISGFDWLNDFLETGLVTKLSSNGYPTSYRIPLSLILEIITGGMPLKEQPVKMPDGSLFTPADYWNFSIDTDVIKKCSKDSYVIFEAWDKS